MKTIQAISFISLIIACYYIIYYLYLGINNPIPSLGDSWDYHIPISKSILNGTFLHPTFKEYKQFFPGSSEAINSIFLYLNIPLTISNIFATVILFFCLLKFAFVFRLQRYYALLYSLTFVTLTAVTRWANSVSIDVWIGVFFVLAIILLENPKKNAIYFLKLGFVLGMLIGSKYTGIPLFSILVIFYVNKLWPYLRLTKLIMFVITFSIFGIFWYLRNYLVVHNPFYPIPVFGFPGRDIFGYYTILNVGLAHPLEMFNAGFGEYKIWLISIFIGLIYLIHQFVIKKDYYLNNISKLFMLGLVNLLLFFSFGTSEQTWIMVSSFRYSYPTFIPLILGVFLLAKKHNKENLVGYLSVANMLGVISMIYYPKLILVYFPIAIVFFYLFEKRTK